jgi:hypothetical protein
MATFFSAMVNNVLSLGFDVAKILGADYVSAFYRLITPPQVMLALTFHPNILTHLQPTLPQILHSHQPYLDLLPQPLLYARLIIHPALMPHTFYHLDFKQDIYVNGSAQMWNMRSYMAAQWFLRKWKMLIDGEGNEFMIEAFGAASAAFVRARYQGLQANYVLERARPTPDE